MAVEITCVTDSSVDKKTLIRIKKITEDIITYMNNMIKLKIKKITVNIIDDAASARLNATRIVATDTLETQKLKKWIARNAGCFAYYPSNEEAGIFIVIKNFPHLKSDYALKGIIAHELMHVSHGIKGLDKFVVISATKQWDRLLTTLRNIEQIPGINIERDILLETLMKLLLTSGLVIKDILVDTQLVSIGLHREVYMNYLYTLQGDTIPDTELIKRNKLIEEAILREIKAGRLDTLLQMFEVEIGLMSSWIPLHSFKYEKESNHILEKIDKQVAVPNNIRKNIREAGYHLIDLGAEPTRKKIKAVYSIFYAEFYDVLKTYLERVSNGENNRDKI